jgi:hypothetical protein
MQHTADSALADRGIATALSSARALSAVYVLMMAKAEIKDLLERQTGDTRKESSVKE